jgi:hypothetical protein
MRPELLRSGGLGAHPASVQRRASGYTPRMQILSPRSLTISVLALTLSLAAPGIANAAAPKLLKPKAGAPLTAGSEPTFKVRDGSAAAQQYKIYITIGTSKKRTKNGDLKRTSIGTFASTKRKGTVFSYTPEDYSFDTWFMNRPGTYYWQAFHIDCAVKGCHVHSKIRSFKVQ